MIYYTTIGIAAWFLCGLLAAGYHFAYFHDEFRFAEKDTTKTLLLDFFTNLIGGPVSLAVIYSLGFTKHGWRLRNKKYQTTEWHPGVVRPAYKGWYERDYIFTTAKDLWDGNMWNYSDDDEYHPCPNQYLPWRGILK